MSDKETVRFMTASAIVVNLLGWCIPAHASDGWNWAHGQPAPIPVAAEASAGGGGAGAQNSDARLSALPPEVRQLMVETLATVKANCETGMASMHVYDCDCYVQEFFQRLLKAGTETGPSSIRDTAGVGPRQFKNKAAVLSEMQPVSQCISTPKIEKHGRDMAAQLSLSAAAIDCAGRELARRFKQQPNNNPQYLNGLLREVLPSCASGQGAAASSPAGSTATPPSTAASGVPPAAATPPAAGAGANPATAGLAPAAANAPSSTPKAPATAAGQATSPATPSPAVPDTNDSAVPAGLSGSPQASVKSGSNTKPDAQLGRDFSGAWVVVKRSGGADAYLPGHVAESSVLHITDTDGVMTLGKTPQHRFTTYRVDGVEHPFSWTRPNTPPDQATTTGTVAGTRDGNRIVVDIKVKHPPTDGRSAAVKRVFSLTPDGGLLVETSGGFFDHEGSLQQDLNGTWLYKRYTTETTTPHAVASSAGKSQASSPAAPTTPTAAAHPATTTTPPTKAPPEQTETLSEKQKKTNEDVSAKTASIVADLKKKADAQLAQANAASQAASQAAAQPPGAQSQSPASAGPAWQPCGGDLRSGASQTAVPVEFVNTSTQPRKLYWFDFAGAKVAAGSLQPGQRAPIQTYMTHAWMIADGSDQCMGTLVIAKAGSIAIR
jgi:hypothetical protein